MFFALLLVNFFDFIELSRKTKRWISIFMLFIVFISSYSNYLNTIDDAHKENATKETLRDLTKYANNAKDSLSLELKALTKVKNEIYRISEIERVQLAKLYDVKNMQDNQISIVNGSKSPVLPIYYNFYLNLEFDINSFAQMFYITEMAKILNLSPNKEYSFKAGEWRYPRYIAGFDKLEIANASITSKDTKAEIILLDTHLLVQNRPNFQTG